jgi:hypothetical protein
MSKSTKITRTKGSKVAAQHLTAAKRGAKLGRNMRGIKRKGQYGALQVKLAATAVAGSIAAFATSFWKAV